MRVLVHPRSSWATAQGLDRVVLAGLGVLVLAAAAMLVEVGFLAVGCAVLGIGVLGVVAFVCTAPEADLLFARVADSDDADAT